MLNIFLEICREDYVGGDDAGSKSKLVHEVYKQISLIKMSNVDTLDEICELYQYGGWSAGRCQSMVNNPILFLLFRAEQ